jgi:NADP-dependent aldehyde dehydrogenase
MTEPPVRTVETAADLAASAAAELARSGPAARAAMLCAVADALETSRSELVDVADKETALGTTRLDGELTRTTGQLRLFADVVVEGSWLEATIDTADSGAKPPRPDIRRLLVGLGPVAVYAASNFPFAFSVAGGDTAAAWAAGCPVIVKAHPGHPALSRHTAAVVADALDRAGAPPGSFGLVEGFDEGRALVTHPAVRAAAFTGSLRGGRALFDLAAARPDPIPFYGELGSINPVVVGPRRAAARAAEVAAGLVASFQLGRGQFCTKPGLVLVPNGSALPELVAGQLHQGAGPMLTEAIATGYDAGVAALAATAGVRVVGVGPSDGPSADRRVPGRPPTVFATTAATVLAAPGVLLEECFGPTTLLVEYGSAEELADVIAAIPGALTASVHADDDDLADLEAALHSLQERVGRIVFDGWPTGVAVNWSMQHGGPWPATTNSLFTSVGATSLRRFLRPLTFQDAPAAVLPQALQDANPLHIPRRIDGVLQLA